MSLRLMTAVWPLDIPSTDKLVLLALADQAHDDGITWIAVRTKREGKIDILTKTSLSERSIQGAIKRLCAEGYLHRKENSGRGVVYLVDPDQTGEDDFPIPVPFQTPAKSVGTSAKSASTPATVAGKPLSNRKSTEEPPSPQGGEVKLGRFSEALALAADAGMTFEELSERIWLLQPKVGEKRRSAGPDVRQALERAVRRAKGTPSEIHRAMVAYYGLPDCTKDGGQYARGAAVILNADRWMEYAPQAGAAAPEADRPAVAFDGPQALRESVQKLLGEDFVRSWIDTCRWNPSTRTLLARNAFGLAKLNDNLGRWMRVKDVRAAIFGAEPEAEPEEPI